MAKNIENKTSKAPAKKTSKRRVRFFREVVSEMKKVSWPSRKELTNYTIAVLAVIAIFTIVIFVFDSGLGFLYNLVIS